MKKQQRKKICTIKEQWGRLEMILMGLHEMERDIAIKRIYEYILKYMQTLENET